MSDVPLLRAKLPRFLLVVPIKASASSHPPLQLPVSLPPTDGWLAFLFRVLEFPGSNLVKKGFLGVSSFPEEIPGMFSQTGRQPLPSLSFPIHISLIVLLCNVIYITVA